MTNAEILDPVRPSIRDHLTEPAPAAVRPTPPATAAAAVALAPPTPTPVVLPAAVRTTALVPTVTTTVVRTPTAPPPAAPAPGRGSPADAVARWGRSPVSPFHCEPENTFVPLPGGGGAGYRPVRRWAIVPTDPAVPRGLEAVALDSLLDRIAEARRRPAFAAVQEPELYRTAGFHLTPVADDATVDLGDFSLSGKRMASIRHSVTSARRAGLRVVPFAPDLAAGVAAVSQDWLRSKRGGEMGFTLGRFDPDAIARTECRVVVDTADHVVGFATWLPYADGSARVLDLMRRAEDAPNPTMDLLIADSLLGFAAAGVDHASLGAVPRSRGRLAERVYPTISLRRYKEKFAPTWEPLWLAAPSRAMTPRALAAIGAAYCPGGLLSALRRNA